ncbi:hypothetical protein H0H87_008607 [Tephrocybe sp. NHM501043]|nr:hypothetical protein H0H87_008607 [Tephrocybe sp. NHM501043]
MVTYETSLPFEEVIARLDIEVNKAGAGQFILRLKNATTKKDLEDLVHGVTGSNDFLYFLEMNHHKWLNVYHEAESTPPAVVYTIGNPIFAETFMRRDVRAGYNIPPRLMVVQNSGSDAKTTTVFYHLPSSLVVLDDEELTRAVKVVDEKLEEMITRVTADSGY